MDILQTLPTDSVVSAAFAELLDDVTNLLSASVTQKPLDKEEVSFWKRQYNSLNKAQYHWLQGVRPALSGDAYLVPSASRPGALIHRLTKQGGIVVCSCEAGQRGILCWHHVLINIVERAAELESLAARRHEEDEAEGNDPEQAPEIDAQALLAERLAATEAIIDAMREAQHKAPIAHIGQRLATARRVYLEAA